MRSNGQVEQAESKVTEVNLAEVIGNKLGESQVQLKHRRNSSLFSSGKSDGKKALFAAHKALLGLVSNKDKATKTTNDPFLAELKKQAKKVAQARLGRTNGEREPDLYQMNDQTEEYFSLNPEFLLAVYRDITYIPHYLDHLSNKNNKKTDVRLTKDHSGILAPLLNDADEIVIKKVTIQDAASFVASCLKDNDVTKIKFENAEGYATDPKEIDMILVNIIDNIISDKNEYPLEEATTQELNTVKEILNQKAKIRFLSLKFYKENETEVDPGANISEANKQNPAYIEITDDKIILAVLTGFGFTAN